MTTLEQAARQALEALETISVDVKTTSNAYEAQRQAVAALREALEQAEQEPVAYSYTSRITGTQTFSLHPKPPHLDSDSWDIKPLYTAPPKREWVGLTDEEIEQGKKESWVTEQAWQSAVWWAEQKLKEKNT